MIFKLTVYVPSENSSLIYWYLEKFGNLLIVSKELFLIKNKPSDIFFLISLFSNYHYLYQLILHYQKVLFNLQINFIVIFISIIVKKTWINKFSVLFQDHIPKTFFLFYDYLLIWTFYFQTKELLNQ